MASSGTMFLSGKIDIITGQDFCGAWREYLRLRDNLSEKEKALFIEAMECALLNDRAMVLMPTSDSESK